MAGRPRSLRRRSAEWKRDLFAVRNDAESDRFWAYVHANQPSFREAVAADARVTAARRGERHDYRSSLDLAVQVVRLMLVTEAFFAQVCYRAKVACRRRQVPFLPVLLDRLSVMSAALHITDTVIVGPGMYIAHGQVVLSGMTRIGRDSYFSPWSGLGLVSGNVVGPTVGDHLMLGTGSRILGPVTIGHNVTIGANSLVLHDVPDDATAIGNPARPLTRNATEVGAAGGPGTA